MNTYYISYYGKVFSSKLLKMQDHYSIAIPYNNLKCSIVLSQKNTVLPNHCSLVNQGSIGISTMISVLIFLGGFIVNEALRRKHKSIELTQYKLFIKEWVKKSNGTLSIYIRLLNDFSKNISKNTSFNVATFTINTIHLQDINKIPVTKFSDIYIFGLNKDINNENQKHLMDFLYQLEYLNKVPNIINEKYHEYCEYNNRIMDEWNSNYIRLLDSLEYNKGCGISEFENSTIEKIIKLCSEINKTGKTVGTDKWNDQFIRPTMEILSKKNNSILLKQIFIEVRNLEIVLFKHDELNKYSEVFHGYVTNLSKAQNIINESMKYFNSKKIRSFCK